MNIVLKLFLSVFGVLVFLYLVTSGASLMNVASDTSVTAGVVLQFLAVCVIFCMIRYLWFPTSKVTSTKKTKKEVK